MPFCIEIRRNALATAWIKWVEQAPCAHFLSRSVRRFEFRGGRSSPHELARKLAPLVKKLRPPPLYSFRLIMFSVSIQSTAFRVPTLSRAVPCKIDASKVHALPTKVGTLNACNYQSARSRFDRGLEL